MPENPDISQRCQAALLSLLERQSFSDVRMAQIAAAANTSRPTLYRYYASKEQLFR